MNEIISIGGVECYEKDGTAYLKLETVARGLGLVQVKNGVEYVKWERVSSYLEELGFSPEVGKDGFIPENTFYRLAMKAKNETAEKFQAKVADEIIPSIRKHGAYMTSTVLERALESPDFLIELATRLKEEKERNKALKAENDQMRPKAEFFDAVTGCKDAIEIGKVAKVLNYPGIGRNKLFEILRDKGILMRDNIPYQKYIDNGCFRTIEQKYSTPTGETRISIKTLVYQKGVDYIREILEEE